MTCIVGVQTDGYAVIGGDSASVSGWQVERRAGAKVFRVGAFLYGIAGDWRMADVLRWSFNPPKRTAKLDVDHYMHTFWIDALRAVMKDKGLAVVNNGSESMGEGTFLVAHNGVLYEVGQDYQIGQSSDGYYAIGSGASVALGAMYAGRAYTPVDRAHIALQAAAHHNMGVCEPFTVEDDGTGGQHD